MYIHERKNWTDFRWDAGAVAIPLDKVCREQGRLFGRLSGLGFESQLQAVSENLTRDVVYSSEIEGIELNVDAVRSSIARRLGIENVKYTAPSPDRVEPEMTHFLDWFNSPASQSLVIRSAIAHLWFVAIHPFEDGNGRLARIIADMLLARGDQNRFRFYNISSAINRDKRHYYKILEETAKGDGDITQWITWYLETLLSAIHEADTLLDSVLRKSMFWMHASGIPLSERQTAVLNIFLDGYAAKITSKSWAHLGRCSKDTAIRDIQDLLRKGLLAETEPGAKRPSYYICVNS